MIKYLVSHWFWFFVLYGGFRVYDFIEQINMTDSLFKDHPADLFSFILVSSFTFCLLFYFVSSILKYIKLPAIVADLVAFVGSFLTDLLLSNSLWNFLLWTHSDLNYSINYDRVAVALLAYILFRILFLISNVLAKKVT